MLAEEDMEVQEKTVHTSVASSALHRLDEKTIYSLKNIFYRKCYFYYSHLYHP